MRESEPFIARIVRETMPSSKLRPDVHAMIRDDAHAGDRSLRRLEEILRALPIKELDALVSRLSVRIDSAKRIDAVTQLTRALVGGFDLWEPSSFSGASRELLHRIAESGGSLAVPVLPTGVHELVARGLVFGRKATAGFVLVLPLAFYLKLRPWESEDPRSLRALLAQASPETLANIAAHYLGRPATGPVILAIEEVWDQLSDPAMIAAVVAGLTPAERRILETIESLGGEVDTEELLDLERDPMRIRTASGITASRRGVGFALERRGYLVPVHANRYVMPAEIAAVVGAERRGVREARRAEIRKATKSSDLAPRRARFASDPGMLAVVVAIAVREAASEVRAGVGTPRSLLVRVAHRFGRDVDEVSIVAALSRALGLWEAGATSLASPPGGLTLHELSQRLFHTWQRGGAWDEGRGEAEALRLTVDQRDNSPAGTVRALVLEALRELGDGRWVSATALSEYVASDSRASAIERLFKRWSERTLAPVPRVADVARRIATESLPALGIVDVGTGTDLEGDTAKGDELWLRVSARGRALIDGVVRVPDGPAGGFIDATTLRVSASAEVASVLLAATVAEVGSTTDAIELFVRPMTVARALAAGVEPGLLRARIEALAVPSDAVLRLFEDASVVLGRGGLASASGFVWIEDAEIRELLRTRRATAELFVDPSPPGGLLVSPGIEVDRLRRRCRSIGVEITLEAERASARVASEDLAPNSSVRPRARTTRRR